ncbi:MAG TPA: response regulator transcription factor [Chloroflexota bacterium]|jgi:DNA-binding response OmpR family regulator
MLAEGPEGSIGSRDRRVLLVEDDPALRAAMAEMLEGRGHRVVALGDGAAAWRALQAEAFPLLVTDLGLPGLDGLELCRRLRGLRHGDASVVLVVTARTAPGDLRAVLDAGADDYLAKPFSVDLFEVRLAVMERRVAEVARRRQAEAELAARARLDGAVKTALTVVDRLGNQLAVLVANADLLAEMVDGEARNRAERLARGGRDAATVLGFLGRVARLEQLVAGDESMLDPDAAAGHDRMGTPKPEPR